MIFQSKPDRRRHKRQLLNAAVQVFTDSAHLDGLGINITDVGMCLFTMANLSLGSHIEVKFMPSQSLEPVRLSGIVRHRAVYLYGIEFVLDSEQRLGPLQDVGTIPGRHGTSYQANE